MRQDIRADRPTVLALRAALQDPSNAAAAWRQLDREHGGQDLTRLPSRLGRAMPRIYLNLRGQSDIPNLARLRGTYRSTWSTNAWHLSQAAPVLQGLVDEGIEHRVIKGAALLTIGESLGHRRMGDVDLVVPQASLAAATAMLSRAGFCKAFGGTLTGPRSHESGLWRCRGGAKVDIHPVSKFRSLARLAFRDQGLVRTWHGTEVHTPSADCLLAIAVGHGERHVGEGDRVQTILDVSDLMGCADLEATWDLLGQQGLQAALVRDLDLLQSLDIYVPPDWSTLRTRPYGIRWKDAAWRFRESVARTGWRVSQAPVLAVRRRPGSARLTAWPPGAAGRRSIYFMWIASGRARALEEAAFRLLGGFLPDPPGRLGAGQMIQVDLSSPNTTPRSDVTVAEVNCLVDSRVKVRTSMPKPLRVSVGTLNRGKQPLLVFINGKLVDELWPDEQCVAVREGDNVPDQIEVSVRSLVPLQGHESVVAIVFRGE